MWTSSSIEIDRPIDEVFDYTMNNVVEWSIMVVEDEVIEETPNGVGTTFRNVTEENGKRMEFLGRVTRHERPTCEAIHLTGEYFDIEAEYHFEELSSARTKVTQKSQAHGKGFFGKLMVFTCGFLMHFMAKKSINSELESLKQHAENR